MNGTAHPSRRRAAIAVAVTVVLALVASACSSGSDDDDAAGEGSRSTGATVTVDTLAEAGIAVFAHPEDAKPLVAPAEPVSPVRLLEWQFDNLAAQTGGLTAAQLDDAVPGVDVDDHEIPPSALIAAWAEEFDTAAAAQARELLAGPADWPDEIPPAARPVFSDLVLILFASDVATVGASLPGQPEQTEEGAAGAPAVEPAVEAASGSVAVIFDGPQVAPQDIGSACQVVVGFAANVRAAVTNALNRLIVNPEPVSTGFGPFDTLINTVVQGAAGLFNLTVKAGQVLVDGVVQATVGEVLEFVARIAGVVGTLAEIKNAVQPWTLTLREKDPTVNQVGVRPALLGPPGGITARVTAVLDTWPAGIERCARDVGRPLPSLKPSGNKVEWKLQGFDPTAPLALAVIDEESTERALSEDGTARLAYNTGVEDPPEPDADLQDGFVVVSVHVTRDDIIKLEDSFNTLVVDVLTGALPLGGVPFARELVVGTAKKLLSEITAEVAKALAKVRDRDEHGFVVVRYHTPGDDDKTDGKTDTSQPAAVIPASCPSSTRVGYPSLGRLINADGTQFDPNIEDCVYGHGDNPEVVIFIISNSGATHTRVPGPCNKSLEQIAAEADAYYQSGGTDPPPPYIGCQTGTGSELIPNARLEDVVPGPDADLVSLPGVDQAWFVELQGPEKIQLFVRSGGRAMAITNWIGPFTRDQAIEIARRILGIG